MDSTFRAEEKINLQSTDTKSDSFTVEMEQFSHLSSKNGITLQRNLSRKGWSTYRGAEKKMDINVDNPKDGSCTLVPVSSSQTVDSSTPEKPILVTVGVFNKKIHQHITITTPATDAESKLRSKRNSFKRSSFWTIDPRRILLFFATLSSMGTILLIYLTLSLKDIGLDDNSIGILALGDFWERASHCHHTTCSPMK